jgi:hypothetical protein
VVTANTTIAPTSANPKVSFFVKRASASGRCCAVRGRKQKAPLERGELPFGGADVRPTRHQRYLTWLALPTLGLLKAVRNAKGRPVFRSASEASRRAIVKISSLIE